VAAYAVTMLLLIAALLGIKLALLPKSPSPAGIKVEFRAPGRVESYFAFSMQERFR
jgi:hypothetical protein